MSKRIIAQAQNWHINIEADTVIFEDNRVYGYKGEDFICMVDTRGVDAVWVSEREGDTPLK